MTYLINDDQCPFVKVGISPRDRYSDKYYQRILTCLKYIKCFDDMATLCVKYLLHLSENFFLFYKSKFSMEGCKC